MGKAHPPAVPGPVEPSHRLSSVRHPHPHLRPLLHLHRNPALQLLRPLGLLEVVVIQPHHRRRRSPTAPSPIARPRHTDTALAAIIRTRVRVHHPHCHRRTMARATRRHDHHSRPSSSAYTWTTPYSGTWTICAVDSSLPIATSSKGTSPSFTPYPRKSWTGSSRSSTGPHPRSLSSTSS